MQSRDDSIELLRMLLGCVLVVAGISIARFNLSLIPIAEASVGWTTTEGRITKFEIVERVMGEYETEVFCGPMVQYTYSVDGYLFTTDRVSFNSYINENCSAIKADLYNPRYTVGKQIFVYYDPEQPSMAVLEPGACVTCYPHLMLGGIFGFVGIFGLGKASRKLFGRN